MSFSGIKKDEVTNESGMMDLHLNQIPNPVGMGRKQSPKEFTVRKSLLQAHQDWLMKLEELSFIMD